MARNLTGTVWAGVAAALLGFFLPWATLDIKTTQAEKQIASSVRRSLGKTFKSIGRSGSRQSSWIRSKKGTPIIPTRVSGFQLPQLANRQNVKVVTGLVELSTKQRGHLGLNSYAVYLVPGLALLCGWLLTARGGAARPVAAGVAMVCGAVAVAGAGPC